MGNVVVVGTQWGDEGKGKIVDWLSHKADVILRFQGGHNAGHTLVIDENVYKLNLVPSGILRKGKISVIGNGVVVDPWVLQGEIERLQGQGVEISKDNLFIAENTTLILPLHRELDIYREEIAGKNKIGTTGSGIGPAYEDKVGRRAMRVMDLQNKNGLLAKIDRLLVHHNALRKGLNMPIVDRDNVYEELCQIADFMLHYMDPLWQKLEMLLKKGKIFLFEGAQGVMLDIDHGTYPFVTSSNTVAAQASIGTGIGLQHIDYVLGILKAYTTRVGSGPFPTEQDNSIGKYLGEKGHEFGTVTGRKRRCGWFDAVMVKQAIKKAGITGVALTKLDILDEMEEIKVCKAYRLDGQIIDYLPASQSAQNRLEPIYDTLPGWKEKTHKMTQWDTLPQTAKEYVRYIEKIVEAPVSLLSTSPQREDTIILKDPFMESMR